MSLTSIVLILDAVLGEVTLSFCNLVLVIEIVLFLKSISEVLSANNSPARNPVYNWIVTKFLVNVCSIVSKTSGILSVSIYLIFCDSIYLSSFVYVNSNTTLNSGS